MAANLVEVVRRNPDAVFVRSYEYRTFKSIKEDNGFYRGGADIIKDLFEKGQNSHKELILKPNIVSGKSEDMAKRRNYHGGIVTNARFIGGMIDELFKLGETSITVTEGGVGQGTFCYADNGYIEMMTEPMDGKKWETRENRGARLNWMNKHHWKDYREDEITWIKVPNGVVHKEFPIVSPVRRTGTALISVPTMKTHNLGVMTLCCKGLQGVIATGYKHFCSGLEGLETLPPEILEHFQPDFIEKILAENERHMAMKFPYWGLQVDRKYNVASFETWGQRIADAVSIFKPYEKHFLLNVVEGIIGRNGTAFNQGFDVPVGLVVAGVNPVHVDAVAGFLMGHDPRYVPFLIIANERGLGQNDLRKINVFGLPDMRRLSIEELESMVVTLPVYLHGNAKNQILFNEKFFKKHNIPISG